MADWFEKETLRFSCTKCGKCCTGSPGYVWVSPEEIEQIAQHLNLTSKEVIIRYTRRVGQRLSLIERKNDYSCIFLKDNQCTLYHARPLQCRTYPFWPSILKSKESWVNEANACEGIREDAELIATEKIKAQLNASLF